MTNSRTAWAKLAANFYGNPGRDLVLVGITGTNGKTSTVTFLHQLLTALGYKCGMMSTIEIMIGTNKYENLQGRTTYNPSDINKYLREMSDQGCTHCVMEVSSHGLVQKRVEGKFLLMSTNMYYLKLKSSFS